MTKNTLATKTKHKKQTTMEPAATLNTPHAPYDGDHTEEISPVSEPRPRPTKKTSTDIAGVERPSAVKWNSDAMLLLAQAMASGENGRPEHFIDGALEGLEDDLEALNAALSDSEGFDKEWGGRVAWRLARRVGVLRKVLASIAKESA